jgi:hypothetical protein
MLLLALFAVVATAVFNGKPIGFDPPYLVRVAGDCTGSVLSSRYVLTAAHCLFPLQAEGRLSLDIPDVMVRAGNNFFTGITEFYIAEKFSWIDRFGTGAANDLAIVKLANPLPGRFTPVRWDALAPTSKGTPIMFQGYGLVGRSRAEGANEGRGFLNFCTSTVVGEGLLCQTDLSRTLSSVCPGDSGGPLFANSGVQIGVTSFGSCMNGVSIWANVQNARSWIRSVLAGQVPPTKPLLERRLPGEGVEQFFVRSNTASQAWREYLRREREKLGLQPDGTLPRPTLPSTPRQPRAPSQASFVAQPREMSALDRIQAQQQQRQ